MLQVVVMKWLTRIVYEVMIKGGRSFNVLYALCCITIQHYVGKYFLITENMIDANLY